MCESSRPSAPKPGSTDSSVQKTCVHLRRREWSIPASHARFPPVMPCGFTSITTSGFSDLAIRRHLPQGICHHLAAVVDPLLNRRIVNDLHPGRRVRLVPLGRVDVVDVLESEAFLALRRRVLLLQVRAESARAGLVVAGIGLGIEIEVVEVDEVGLDLFDRVPDDLLQIIEVLLVGEARPVAIRLLVPVGEQDGPAARVALDPVLGPRFLGEEGLVHHGVPLDVGVDLEAEAVGNLRRAFGLLHPGHLGGHAEALVEMGVEHLDALLLQPAQRVFALRERRSAHAHPAAARRAG